MQNDEFKENPQELHIHPKDPVIRYHLRTDCDLIVVIYIFMAVSSMLRDKCKASSRKELKTTEKPWKKTFCQFSNP